MIPHLIVGVISDVHADSDRLNEVLNKISEYSPDSIIVAGDLTNKGSVEQVEELLNEILGVSENTLFVLGNCDDPRLVDVIEGLPGIGLHGNSSTIGEFEICGIGGSTPTPFSTPFEISEEELYLLGRASLNSVSERSKVILLTHDAPRMTSLDLSYRGHVGSEAVRRLYLENSDRISLGICGHIHESPGRDLIGNVEVFNPGAVIDGRYLVLEISQKDEKDVLIRIVDCPWI